MKKFLCAILAALMVLSMAACSSSEPQTVVLTMEQNGVSIDYQLDAKGDIVQKITQTTTMDCSAYTEDQIAAVEEAVAQYEAAYNAIEGVTYTAGLEGTDFVETIIIDTTDEDTISELSAQGLVPVEGEGLISLEKTVELMKEQGFTEK